MSSPHHPFKVTTPSPIAELRKAFSLLEVLVTVAILGIFVGLLLPLLSQMRSNADGAKCMGNMRQIALSLIDYANDHDGRTVAAHYPDEDYNWAQQVTKWDGSSQSLIQFKNYGIWRCPSNLTQTKSPMANGTGPANTSYMINGYRNSAESSENRYANNKVANFRKPSQLYMVLEGRYFRSEVSSQNGSQTIPENIYNSARSLNYARYPHAGKMNIAFADGHVARVSGPVLDRGSSGGSGASGFTNGDAWYAY